MASYTDQHKVLEMASKSVARAANARRATVEDMGVNHRCLDVLMSDSISYFAIHRIFFGNVIETSERDNMAKYGALSSTQSEIVNECRVGLQSHGDAAGGEILFHLFN
jgi:hypothetical protein